MNSIKGKYIIPNYNNQLNKELQHILEKNVHELARNLEEGIKEAIKLLQQIDEDITYEAEEEARVGRFGLPHTTCMSIEKFIKKWNKYNLLPFTQPEEKIGIFRAEDDE